MARIIDRIIRTLFFVKKNRETRFKNPFPNLSFGYISFKKSLWPLLLFLCFASFSGLFVDCIRNNEIKYADFIHFDDQGILPDKEYIFSTEYMDSTLALSPDVQAWILIRYSERCNLMELPLKLETTSPFNDSVSQYEVNVPLFNKDDTNNRDGYGILEVKYPLPFKPDYREGGFISLQTGQTDSKGIMAAGLILEKIKTKSDYETDN